MHLNHHLYLSCPVLRIMQLTLSACQTLSCLYQMQYVYVDVSSSLRSCKLPWPSFRPFSRFIVGEDTTLSEGAISSPLRGGSRGDGLLSLLSGAEGAISYSLRSCSRGDSFLSLLSGVEGAISSPLRSSSLEDFWSLLRGVGCDLSSSVSWSSSLGDFLSFLGGGDRTLSQLPHIVINYNVNYSIFCVFKQY